MQVNGMDFGPSGNVLPGVDFFTDELQDLHERVASTRQYGPVVPVQFGGKRAWLINDYDILKQAFADQEHFDAAAFYQLAAEPIMGKTLQAMNGEQHRVNRALVSKKFFPQPVSEMVKPIIEVEANRILDRLEGQEQVDLVKMFAQPFPFSVIARLLGIPVHDEEQLLHWALMLIDFSHDMEGGEKAKREFDEYITELIHARREATSDDLLSSLATVSINDVRLSDEEILSFCRLLFPAGSDSAYKSLSSLTYHLLTNPQYIEMLFKDEESLQAVVHEALRMEPPSSIQPRLCSKDISLGGVGIRAGDSMLFAISGANDDPKYFENPRLFNPYRKQETLMTFGGGTHFCVGTHLAKRELAVGIKLLFERYPNMQLVPDQTVEITRTIMRGPKEIWVNLKQS